MSRLKAGSAQTDITPRDSQFLYGYPHVERYSTGVHDRLWSSALYLANTEDESEIMFIANDIIHFDRDITNNIRTKINARTGMNPESIMLTATHTHSGPKTADHCGTRNDPAVPDADKKYLDFMQDRIVEAGCRAYENARPAKLGLSVADATGIGTNRRNPSGPADFRTPVMMVKTPEGENIACMLVCSMHPTVLHEDSKLISGDFPGMARIYLQENVLGRDCPVLHHTGPAGNQSPRHVTKSNTFEEAERIGVILGKAVESAIKNIEFSDDFKLASKRALLNDLPRQKFPAVADAQDRLARAVAKLDSLRKSGAPRQQTRTAECDWFGAEAMLALAKAAEEGGLETAYSSCLPAEIQMLKIGKWNFIGWPGEIFVEYALQVKKHSPDTYIISLANGILRGYIVTREAFEEGGYEAAGALFRWNTGELFVRETLKLLEER